jgi:hypothetical protein
LKQETKRSKRSKKWSFVGKKQRHVKDTDDARQQRPVPPHVGHRSPGQAPSSTSSIDTPTTKATSTATRRVGGYATAYASSKGVL